MIKTDLLSLRFREAGRIARGSLSGSHSRNDFPKTAVTCCADSCPLIVSVPVLTKELSTIERVQPSFIEPMQVAPVRELSDGGNGPTRPSSTATAAFPPSMTVELCSGHAAATDSQLAPGVACH